MNPIGSRAAHDTAVARMTALSTDIATLQGQISSGKRLATSADDPVAFARVGVLRRGADAREAQGKAIDAAVRRLGATDIALSGMTAIVERAKELALQGASGTLSDADRASLATEAAELTRDAAALAESRGDDGERLFAGAGSNATGGAAYAVDPATGARVWQGHGAPPGLALGGATLATGLTGPQAFGEGAAGLFDTLDGLGRALAETDPDARAAAFAATLDGLDGQVSRLADSRATLGARLARLDGESDRLARGKTDTEIGLTKLEGLDLTEAIARLQRLSTVLQAAQASFTRINALSLWEQLR